LTLSCLRMRLSIFFEDDKIGFVKIGVR